jgi:long-chain acyl-CoA synthetase
MYSYFMDVAKKTGIRKLEGRSISLSERFMYFLGEALIYGPLKNSLGMSRVRVAYTAGEAIGPEIFDFYRSLGINIKQIYGQTEASIFVTVQPDNEVRSDTVGIAAPDVEIKIDDSGEVLYRSPGVFKNYYKNEEATLKTKNADGWVFTGDAGFFNEEGHLRIIDRAKDVGKFNNGKLFAPKYIENKLKFFPYIQEAVCFGDKRDTCTTLINIDMEAVSVWAERNNVSFASYQELAAKDAVYGLIKECIEKINQDLTDDPMLSHSQITRFLVLHKELDADDGELTRTRKVRRPFIADRYAVLIDALYSDKTNCFIETEVSFEDGRTSKISADLKISDSKTYESKQRKSSE